MRHIRFASVQTAEPLGDDDVPQGPKLGLTSSLPVPNLLMRA